MFVITLDTQNQALFSVAINCMHALVHLGNRKAACCVVVSRKGNRTACMYVCMCVCRQLTINRCIGQGKTEGFAVDSRSPAIGKKKQHVRM